MRIRLQRALTSPLFLILAFPFVVPGVHAQDSTLTKIHPHLFFDNTGVVELRARLLNPRLNKIWQRFKAERVDSSFNIQVNEGGELDVEFGRAYGDAISDLTLAYIRLQGTVYAEKGIQIMVDLAAKSDWGNALVKGHISMGYAFAWDVLYDLIPDSMQIIIKDAVLDKANNNAPNDVYTNINWIAFAGEGLIGLSFQGDGDVTFNDFVARLLTDAKFNFKEKSRNVLWGHGTDGFPHQGLGYWRKYIHMGLFFQALRFNEPGEDWFHLGKEYPGSEFLSNTGYPRIYADVQHPDLATLSWADSRQVRTQPGLGPFGNIGLMTLIASEYDDGTIMDFVDYLRYSLGTYSSRCRYHNQGAQTPPL